MGIDFINFNQIFQYSLPGNAIYSRPTEELYDYSIFAAMNTQNDVRFIAHRGDSDDAPENTITALEYAVNNGYTTAECDVSWTRDNVPVLLHDATINRTGRKSSGAHFLLQRKVASYDFQQLQNLDFGVWFSRDFKGTKIPSLEEALRYAKDNNLELYLDLKNNVNLDDDKIATLVSMVEDVGMEDSVSWISFDYKTLKKIAEVMPNARIGYLSKNQITDETINVLKSLKNDTNDVFLDIKYTSVTENGVAKLNEAGFYYEAWTVDNINEAEKLVQLGCRGITTNKLHQD